MARALRHARRAQPRRSAKRSAYQRAQRSRSLDEPVELAELHEPDRGLQVGHPVVEAEHVEVGQRGRARAAVAHLLGDATRRGCAGDRRARGQLGVVGGDHPALAGRDRLARVERERRRSRRGRRRAALVGGARRAGGVLDDVRRSSGSAARTASIVGAQAEQVHGDHRPRALRHARPQVSRVDVVGGLGRRRRTRASRRSRPTTLAVATHVKAGTITSSPGPMPSAARPRCSAVVHDVVASACSTRGGSAKAARTRRPSAPASASRTRAARAAPATPLSPGTARRSGSGARSRPCEPSSPRPLRGALVDLRCCAGATRSARGGRPRAATVAREAESRSAAVGVADAVLDEGHAGGLVPDARRPSPVISSSSSASSLIDVRVPGADVVEASTASAFIAQTLASRAVRT